MKKDGPGSPEENKPLVEYPTVYTFKVMGKQEEGFVEYVRSLFQRLMGKELAHDAVREQPSSKGRYVSLSVSVFLESEEHRRSIYAELHRDERVIYYL
ncbi:DUF493 domain-containing protein [Myxococcaceae bacterium GXIMD 01537]